MFIHEFRCRTARQTNRILLILSTALYSSLCFPALSQVASPPPERLSVDKNNVDLFYGELSVQSPAISMGQEQAGLAYFFKFNPDGEGWTDNFTSYVDKDLETGLITVVVDGKSYVFIDSAGIYTAKKANGSTLTMTGNIYSFTNSFGLVAHFDRNITVPSPYYGNQGYAIDISYPAGHVLTYSYTSEGGVSRLSTVTSNLGYRLDFHYYTDLPFNGGGGFNWFIKTKTDLINTVSSSSLSLLLGIGQVSVSGFNFGTTITDAMGRATQYLGGDSTFSAVAKPGSNSPDITFSYDSERHLSTVTDITGVTTYKYVDADGVRTTTVTDPLSHTHVYRFDLASQLMLSQTDAIGKTTRYQYDTNDHLTQITYPEGNRLKYAYDARGNVTESRQISKTPGTPPDQVASAGYPSNCASAASCNKPIWTKDALGSQTDYTYDLISGNVLTTRASEIVPGGPRATTNYEYTRVNGVQMLSGSSTCIIAENCANSANETKVAISYNNNALPVTSIKQAGDGSTASLTTTSYDGVGNVSTVDGPLPGSADVITYRYNADREIIGTISPDPDGGEPLRSGAVKLTYDARGRLILGEIGTVSDPSDASWAAFATQQQLAMTYDGADRPLTRSLTAGDQSSVLNYVYNHHQLFQQTLVMGGLATNRKSQYTYDENDRQVKITSAIGTPEQSDILSTSYSDNGKVSAVVDGNGNATNYSYDGFDRLQTTTYPGGSYEQLGYDVNGNVTSQRKRDGRTLTFGYDALSRMTSKTVPDARSVFYAYDLTGTMTEAHFDSLGGGDYVKNSYDALGQVLTSTTSMGGKTRTLSYTYDAAGNRAQITHPDGTAFRYDYDSLGRLNRLKDGADNQLGLYVYLDNGKLTWRGQGANGTGYGYDAMGRILSYNMQRLNGGSVTAVNTALSYNAASQIVQQTRNSDAYAYTDTRNVDRNFATNGLNQYTDVGPDKYSYDANGNLTSDGGNTYTYDAENRLTGVSGARSGSLIYDPIGRLWQTSGSSGVTQFLYDGDQLVAEYNNTGGLLRRYVQGTGNDDPLLWYEGASTSPYRLYTDHLGSVVGIIQDDGTMRQINTYDEYGVPGSGNLGRFQYTGQAWIPELGLYYYKARMYSPMLGRFMQTDPIGYGDGLNAYDYVHGDPVNATDPSGTLTADEIFVFGGGGGGGGGFGSVSGALGLIPGVTLGSFSTRPDPDPDNPDNATIDGEGEEVVVTGTRLLQPQLFTIAGNIWDSGLPRDVKALESMLEAAKKTGDTALQRRIIKQLKAAGARNVQKLRGLGKFRALPFILIIPDVLRIQLCSMPGNNDTTCPSGA